MVNQDQQHVIAAATGRNPFIVGSHWGIGLVFAAGNTYTGTACEGLARQSTGRCLSLQ